MSGLPTVQVLLDDGTGTFPYDISTYVRMSPGIKITRGRADELNTVQPGQCAMTLDNVDGRFTVGNPTYGVAVNRMIQVKTTVAGTANVNLLTPDQASMENGLADWSASTNVTIAQVTPGFGADAGTKALQATLTTNAGGGDAVSIVATGLVTGAQYVFTARVYAPTGSPDLSAFDAFDPSRTWITTKNAWATATITFTAPATQWAVGIIAKPSTAGQLIYVDNCSIVLATGPFTRFTGRVKSWPVQWPGGGDEFAHAPIVAYDAQELLQRRTLESVIAEEINLDAPVGHWPLSDPSTATSAVDVSGNNAPSLASGGVGSPVAFGNATGPSTDGGSAASFAGGVFLYGPLPAASLTVECTLLRPGPPAQDQTVLSGGASAGGGAFDLTLTTAGTLRLSTPAGTLFTTATNLADNGTHHLALVLGAAPTLYVDGASAGSSGTAIGSVSSLGVGGSVWSSGFAVLNAGVVSHVATYAAGLSTTRISDHSKACRTGFVGDQVGSRMDRVLTYNKPAVTRVGVAGTVFPGFTNFAGSSLWDELQRLADAEAGILYIAGNGSVVLRDKNGSAPTVVPVLTLTANQVDPGVAPVVDLQGLLNYGTAKRANGATQVATSPSSITTHGRYPTDKTYLLQSDTEVAARIQWLINTHAQPAPRIPALSIDVLTMIATDQASYQGIDVGSLIRVTGWPSQSPTGSTVDLLVQGGTETISADEWTYAANVTNAAPFNVWRLNDTTYSVLGTSTRLYL